MGKDFYIDEGGVKRDIRANGSQELCGVIATAMEELGLAIDEVKKRGWIIKPFINENRPTMRGVPLVGFDCGRMRS